MAKNWTAPELLALSSSYWTACALQAAITLDVFTTIEEMAANGKPVRSSDLAAKLACDERAFSMLATALIALGFLDGDLDGLTLPEHAREYLSRNSDQYVGFIIRHHSHIMPAWAQLAEAVRTGTRKRDNSSSDTESEAEREAFLMGMFNIAMSQAETVAKAFDLAGKTRLLDLGGGPGTYAVFFARENPGLCATIYDRPTSEKFARGVVKRFGLEDRVGFIGGNFLQDELPGGYDVIWISHILHGENPEDARKLVAKAAKSLNPGGMIAIQEFVVDDDRRGPAHPALFGLNMLVGTVDGQAYTWGEMEDFLRSAGAVSVNRLDVALPMSCGILIGRMPE
ncbi:MAG: 3-hydroxy-5-methyl-1-naphthoate 3-O-methyltransferase [Desulfovibrio sp.]